MTRTLLGICRGLSSSFPLVIAVAALAQTPGKEAGREVAIPTHLQDGEEFTTSIGKLIQYGAQLFNAKFTVQEGAGRPKSKGTGAPISDPSSPLVFPRNFDRLSSPDANSCSGCHNAPMPGAGGDRVTEVFVLAQRFDHLTFDRSDGITTRGAVDESGRLVTMENATNDRKTIGMNGSGFVEMLARQMTADLQTERDATPPGSSRQLETKGIYFGTLIHNVDGSWNTSQVRGLAAPSLSSSGTTPPSLIPNDPKLERANVVGEAMFDKIGCATCHATLPLTSNNNPGLPAQPGWIYFEPNPYNPATGPNSPNLQLGPTNYPVSAPALTVDLTSDTLPLPRLKVHGGVVMVPAYTDLKLRRSLHWSSL